MSIISTRPYTACRVCAAMSEGNPTKRKNSGSKISAIAPMTAPLFDASPPRIIADKIKMDSFIVNVEGSMKVM